MNGKRSPPMVPELLKCFPPICLHFRGDYFPLQKNLCFLPLHNNLTFWEAYSSWWAALPVFLIEVSVIPFPQLLARHWSTTSSYGPFSTHHEILAPPSPSQTEEEMLGLFFVGLSLQAASTQQILKIKVSFTISLCPWCPILVHSFKSVHNVSHLGILINEYVVSNPSQSSKGQPPPL